MFLAKLIVVSRWLLFFPSAALLGAILSVIVSSIFEMFQGTNWTLYEELFRSFIFGTTFVLVASYIAPNHQKRIALISCATVIIFALVGSYINLSLSIQPLWNLIVSGASAVSGSILALLLVEKQLNHDRK